MSKEKIISFFFGALSMLSLILAMVVFAWVAPTQPPPQETVPAPINVGIQAQAKEGALVVANNSNVTSTGFIVRYGNVGIGTTTTQAKLDILSDKDNILRFARSGANLSLVFKMDTNSNLRLVNTTTTLVGAPNCEVLLTQTACNYFYSCCRWLGPPGGIGFCFPKGGANCTMCPTAPGCSTVVQETTLLTINNQGRVGIGTSTPPSHLSVQGDTRITGNLIVDNKLTIGTTTFEGEFYLVKGTSKLLKITEDSGYNKSADRVEIYTKNINSPGADGGVDGLKIIGNGWVKIMAGTLWSGAYNPISVQGDSGIIFSGGSINTGNLVIAPWSSGSLGQRGIRITSEGKVGIWTNSPGNYLLRVVGVENNQKIYSEKGYDCGSDLNKKENLEKLTNVIERISNINAYYFNWKDDPKKEKQIGLVAQEVEKYFPELVSTSVNEEGKEEKALDYSRMVAILLEAIKEQQAEIENLKAEISKLK